MDKHIAVSGKEEDTLMQDTVAIHMAGKRSWQAEALKTGQPRLQTPTQDAGKLWSDPRRLRHAPKHGHSRTCEMDLVHRGVLI